MLITFGNSENALPFQTIKYFNNKKKPAVSKKYPVFFDDQVPGDSFPAYIFNKREPYGF